MVLSEISVLLCVSGLHYVKHAIQSPALLFGSSNIVREEICLVLDYRYLLGGVKTDRRIEHT